MVLDDFIYQDKKYEVKVIRKNNKNTYIRVKNKIIYITTNYLVSNKLINKLVKDNYNIIIKMIEKDNNKNKIDDKGLVYLFGKSYDLIYDKKFYVSKDIIYIEDEKQLNKYIYEIVEKKFRERLEYWYQVFEEDIPSPNLKIRKMTSRWGVCNLKNNNVTLNYLLHKYSEIYLDYVIVHELAHFVYPNHSKMFWSLVEKYFPNYKVIRKYLRKIESSA